MHTPGPWEWWTSNSYRRLTSRAGRGGPDGGVLHGTVCRDGCCDVEVSEADMGLIAAAPDMLEALREARGMLRSCQLDEPDEIAKINAAIAKAETPVSR